MKTCFILSEEKDASTSAVMDNIAYFFPEYTVIRRNYDPKIADITIHACHGVNIAIAYAGQAEVVESNFTSVWYRRGDFLLNHGFGGHKIDQQVLDSLKSEWSPVQESIPAMFSANKVLGNTRADREGRKLSDIIAAGNAGLLIPATLVTTRKSDLLQFHDSFDKIITKPLNYHLHLENDTCWLSSTGTRVVERTDITALADHFAPVFVQQFIQKELEIRIFFIADRLFPMAIFSQSDEKTKIDYRNYNEERPNRNVPFRLPEEIDLKVRHFIRATQLSTGSIDLMLGTDGAYYFLEVNPSGQFGWVSVNCNYYLEEAIAHYLCEDHE